VGNKKTLIKSKFFLIYIKINQNNMLNKFITNFKKLPLSNKSMVYLMWIYNVWEIITWTFINIYVFKINNSLENILLYNTIFFTFCLIGFTFIWAIMSELGKNIKYMYYISYFLFILSFILLFIFNSNLFWVNLFWVLFWLWTWTFWCAVHTQELKNIENKNRDFYSSSISAGSNIVSVVTPLLVAFLFYISWFYKFDWYLVLFLVLPIIYVSSFLFIKEIDSYTPKKITREDIINFFDLSKYKYWHLYFLFTWFRQAMSGVIIATIWIVLLKTEENIWLFQAWLTFISTFAVIHLSHKRQEENRLKYYFRVIIAMTILYIIFWMYFWLLSYIIFSLLLLFIKPIFRVSEHVYDLSMMDNIKILDNDFYPSMLLREIILWIWRVISLGIIFILSIYFWFELTFILRIWLIIIWFSHIFLYIWAYLREKHEKH